MLTTLVVIWNHVRFINRKNTSVFTSMKRIFSVVNNPVTSVLSDWFVLVYRVFTRTVPGGRLRKARGEGASPRKTTMTAAWRVTRPALAHPSMIAAPSGPHSSPVEAANVKML